MTNTLILIENIDSNVQFENNQLISLWRNSIVSWMAGTKPLEQYQSYTLDLILLSLDELFSQLREKKLINRERKTLMAKLERQLDIKIELAKQSLANLSNLTVHIKDTLNGLDPYKQSPLLKQLQVQVLEEYKLKNEILDLDLQKETLKKNYRLEYNTIDSRNLQVMKNKQNSLLEVIKDIQSIFKAYGLNPFRDEEDLIKTQAKATLRNLFED